MAQQEAPQRTSSLTTQLSLDGAAEAIALFTEAFGAEEIMRAPDPEGKKIWHATLRIGNSALFVNDVFPEHGGKAQTASLWIYCPEVDAAFARATAAGLTVTMPVADMFWGDRMGRLVDKWGNDWTLCQHVKTMTPEEMQKAQDDFVAKNWK